jgi:hypothetical protein
MDSDAAVPDTVGLPLRELLLLATGSTASADIATAAAAAHRQLAAAGSSSSLPPPPLWFPADHQSFSALNQLVLHEALIRVVRVCTSNTPKQAVVADCGL